MQPTLRQMPPGLSRSTTIAFFLSWPSRIPATYPPGPAPITNASTRIASAMRRLIPRNVRAASVAVGNRDVGRYRAALERERVQRRGNQQRAHAERHRHAQPPRPARPRVAEERPGVERAKEQAAAVRIVVEADERAQHEPAGDPDQLLPNRRVLRECPPAAELRAQRDEHPADDAEQRARRARA